MKVSFPLIGFCSLALLFSSCSRNDESASNDNQNEKEAANLTPEKHVGERIYLSQCSNCHGVNGEGNGPAAIWLYPKPRNFSAGLFKIKSTPVDFLPTDEDLYQTITRGLAGTSMPSFSYLTEKERRNAVEYVKYLTAYTDDEGKRINRFEDAITKQHTADSILVPQEPPITLEALAKGKDLFVKMCSTCHGNTGAGDGPSSATLKDNSGLPLRPRDFNTGSFRGGHTGKDLYLRTVTGMPGTPMPPFDEKVISSEDRWAIVHYVQSLRRKEIEINDILAPADGAIHVLKVSGIYTDSFDPRWESIDPTRIPVNPLWPEPDVIPAVAVKAVHDGSKIAVLLQWRDITQNMAPIRPQDFQDAAAIQFSMNHSTPFIGMGDPFNPVNIWHWKAGWQKDADGRRRDVDTQFPSMHVDMYPESKPLFRTAEAAGNVVSVPEHVSAIEDANARGFGTLKPQPIERQNVKGQGVWRDGFWSVIFIRDLKSGEKEDVVLKAGDSVPVAFAIWNGENRDRNGRKVISNWYHLQIDR